MPKARRVPRATKSVQCVRNARICKATQTSRDFPVDNFSSTVFALGAFLQGEKKAAEMRQRQCEIFLASLAPLLHSGDDSSVRKCLYGMSQNCEKDQEIMQDLLNVLSVMPTENVVVKPDVKNREEGMVELFRQRGVIIDKDGRGRVGQVHQLPKKYKIVGLKKRNDFTGQAKVVSPAPPTSSNSTSANASSSVQGPSGSGQNYIPNSRLSQFHGSKS